MNNGVRFKRSGAQRLKAYLPEAVTRPFNMRDGLPFGESDGIKRRYFDEEQIGYYFDTGLWRMPGQSGYVMDRYSAPKVVWELSLRKKDKFKPKNPFGCTPKGF